MHTIIKTFLYIYNWFCSTGLTFANIEKANQHKVLGRRGGCICSSGWSWEWPGTILQSKSNKNRLACVGL